MFFLACVIIFIKFNCMATPQMPSVVLGSSFFGFYLRSHRPPFLLARRVGLSFALVAVVLGLLDSAVAQSTFNAITAGNWSNTASWSLVSGSGTIPNAVGAVAQRISGGSVTLTQDIAPSVTLGGMALSGSNTGSLTITLSSTVTGTNGLVFNNGGSGVLIINNTGTASSGRIAISSGGTATLADNLTITNNSTATGKTAGSISNAALLAGTGNVTINNVVNDLGYGYVLISNKQNTYVGSTLITSGAVTLSNSSNPTVGNSFFGVSSNTVTLGTTSGGSVSLVAQGYSTNSYLTNQIVVAAGTSGTTVVGSNNVAATGTAGGAALFTGTMTLNGNVTLLSAVSGTILSGTTNTNVFTGVITGTGNVTVLGSATSLGASLVNLGATHLTGVNTFTGNTRITSGTLAIGANSGGTNSLALQNSTVDMNGADSGSLVFGTFQASTGSLFPVASNITSATFGGLMGSRNLALVNTGGTAVSLSIGNNNSSTSYSGALSGAGSVTKVGTGTLSFSGANTYSGTTVVSAGTLLVNGSVSNSAISVSGSATLGGTGLITPNGAKGISVASGGIISPGDGGIESLAIDLGSTTGTVDFASGSTFVFDLNTPGSSDLMDFSNLASASDVTFHSNVINFNNLGGLAAGTYTLFTFDGSNLYTGTLAIGSGLGSFTGTLNYNANSITLDVVPEPAAGALAVVAGLVGSVFLRRRRSVSAR